MMLGGGAPQWQIKDRIKGNRPCSAQAHTTRHTHPTCMSGVALFQVLVVARAFCRRHNVIRCLQRKRDIHTDALERLFASPQPLCSRISLLSQTFLPVLRCPYFTSVNHISVFIILYFMCFPPLQIIVFLRPPIIYHPSSPLSSTINGPHQAPADQHSPGLICAEGGERHVSYTCTAGALSAPSSSRNSDLSSPLLLPLPFFHFRSTHGEVEVGQSGSRLYFSVAAAAGIY